MSDGAPKPTAREFEMLCDKLDRLDRKNDRSHRLLHTKLDAVQRDQGKDRERLVAIEAGLRVLPELRADVRAIEGEVDEIQKDAAVRKARLAGLGAIGGAFVSAVVEIVRGMFSRGA
jgi:chromosome segregation ATPase